MNNNNHNGDRESDIITKKSFLISLPGKKNGGSTGESSIHLSAGSEAAKKNAGAASNGNKTNRFDKAKRRENGNVRERTVGEENGTDEKASRQPKNEKNHFNNKNGRYGKNPVRENVDNIEKTEKHDAEEKKSGGRNERRPNRGKNQDNAKRNVREEKRDKGFSADNRERTEQHDVKKTSYARNEKKSRNDGRKQKRMPLSALSAEISAASVKNEEISRTTEKEPSLEEKYKNAKPLSEQIAEQERRAKGIMTDTSEAMSEEQIEIVGVRFREAGKIYYFNPNGKKIPFGTPVIVETARGNEYGFTAISNRFVPGSSLSSPLKPIERIATEMDTQKYEANRSLEAHAESVFKEKVEKLGLEMTLIYVEYTFDNSRLLFYFTAETRIDFRELVKELAGVFRTRIELRQIGVRDEAKTLGGIGVCGRANCCSTFLGDFAQVSIKMAKDQNLSLNAAKISGACGKLMCCLRYENKVYEEENLRTPKVGSIVETSEGRGHIVERDVLKGTVKVELDASPDAAAQQFNRDDVKVVGFDKQKFGDGDDNISEELKDVEG